MHAMCRMLLALLLAVLLHARPGGAGRILSQAVNPSPVQQALLTKLDDGNLSGSLQGCTDVPPPGGKTCAEHKEAGDCNTSVTTSRNFCASTCDRCQPAPGAATPPAAAPAAAGNQTEPQAALSTPEPAAAAANSSEPVAALAPAPEEATLVADSDSASLPPTPEQAAAAEDNTTSTIATATAAPAPEAEAAANSTEGLSLEESPVPAAEVAATAGAAGQVNGSSVGGAVAVPGSGKVYTGDGTAYSEAVNNTGKGFACSYRYLNDWASVHFAAINLPQWDNGNACGKCATVRCIDPRCTVRNKDVTVMIVDQCPECKEGDLDFSIPVYREITGMWPHRLQVQWQFADCSPFIDGTIKMYPKDGINNFWQAFYIANARFPLKSVKLNGKELQRSQFNFWQNPGPLGDGPHEFELEADNGMRVTAFAENPLSWGDETDTGVQFAEGAPGNSTGGK